MGALWRPSPRGWEVCTRFDESAAISKTNGTPVPAPAILKHSLNNSGNLAQIFRHGVCRGDLRMAGSFIRT